MRDLKQNKKNKAIGRYIIFHKLAKFIRSLVVFCEYCLFVFSSCIKIFGTGIFNLSEM